MMPGDHQIENAFFQESAQGVAEDMRSIIAFG